MAKTKIGIKRKQIGTIEVDAGDVVCFAIDDIMKIAAALGRGFTGSFQKASTDTKAMSDDLDAFIEEHNGVPCKFRSDGIYGVSQVSVITPNGEEYNGVLIGGIGGKVRLLPENVPTYEEFAAGKGHEEAAEGHQSLLRTLWD